MRKRPENRDELMSAIENNGQVTLPTSRAELRLSKRQVRCALIFGALLLSIFRSRR